LGEAYKTQYSLDDVVKIMGHASSKLADHFKFLRLTQFML